MHGWVAVLHSTVVPASKKAYAVRGVQGGTNGEAAPGKPGTRFIDRGAEHPLI